MIPAVFECPICFETLGKKNFAVTECEHKFCLKCLIKSLNEKSTCPLCRGEIEKKTKEGVKILGPNMAGEMIDNVMDEVPIRDFVFMANMFPDRSMTVIKMMIRTVCVELSFDIVRWYAQEDSIGEWSGFDADSSDDDSSDDDGDDNLIAEEGPEVFQEDVGPLERDVERPHSR